MTIDRAVARRIRLVVLDVDGVLTDGGIYMGTAPGQAIELKRFDVQDNIGVKLLQAAGIRVALLSGRVSRATDLRAADLGIEDVHQVPGADKVPVLEEMLREWLLSWDEVAVVGDDLPDLPLLRRAALGAAVANAVPEVQASASWCSSREGGRGAAREFSEALLRARGEWDGLVGEYCRRRSG